MYLMRPMKKSMKHAKYKNQIHIITRDLLPDILLHLPLKSLIQSNLLSKRCHALITKDNVFRHRLISNQNRTPNGLLLCFGYALQPLFDYISFSSSTTTPLKKLDMCNDKRSAIVPRQSCNGLLLYQCGFDKYYVCNLTTNKFLQLPDPHGKYAVWSRVIEMRLAFDPATCPYYKVVAVMRLRKYVDHVYQIYVYSSNNGVWKLSGQPFRKQANYHGGVYWNGAIHWITFSRKHSSCCYFDIQKEMLKTMPSLPVTKLVPGGDDCRNDFYFGESCGHLHYVETGFEQIEIYEMKSDYSEWYVKHSVNVVNMAMGVYNYQTVRILSVVCGQKDEDYFLVLRVPGEVIRFDLVSGTCQKLRDVEDETHIRAFHYIESICSV